MILCRSLCAGALLVLAASPRAIAAAYVGAAHEGFDYTAGNMVNTLAGGTGWNATGDATANTTTWGVTLTPSGTTFTGSGPVFSLGGTAANQQITAGGAALIAGAGQAGRNFGQSVDTGTFYFGFKVKKTVENVRTVNFALFGDNGSTANPNERVTFGQIANNTSLRLADGTADPDAATKANQGKFAVLISAGGAQAGGTFTTGTYPAGNLGVYTAATEQAFTLDQTFLIVGKIEFNYSGGNGADDRITFYINPGSLTDEGSLTPYITLDKFNIGVLVGFRMFAGGTQTVGSTTFNPSAAEFDDIRLGTTYVSVTGASVTPPTPWQAWLSANFTTQEQAQASVSGETADPDGDGGVNLLEYAFGSDPRSAAAGPAPVLGTGAGTLVLDYPASRTDLTYVVETSADLATWTTAGVTDVVSATTTGWRTATVARAENARVFLRVRVTKSG